ncbi:MAG: enoyl-CoA hydratase/isomerase family protein [Cryobacterium sp.]|nr:enoyl-CoA hydratase/isomerase family protein [Cryobacterium sp.]
MLLETEGTVARLVLNRPDKLNAIDAESLELIADYVARVNADPAIRALVVTGRGRAFCAGGDLAELAPRFGSATEFAGFIDRWNEVFNQLEECQVPTIAAVGGTTFAGGLELTHVCDVVVVGDDVVLGDQHATYGFYPAGGGIQRLARLIGRRRAAWVLMSGERFTPSQALEWGLVNEVVPTAQVLDRALEMAAHLSARSALLNTEIKRALRDDLTKPLESAMAIERPRAIAYAMSADTSAGLEAFNARTTPQFPDRRPREGDQ